MVTYSTGTKSDSFKTPATQTASEILTFLSSNPTPQEVLAYHASERSQARLQELLALHYSGILSEGEQLELDELEKIEHVLVMLKAEVTAQLPKKRDTI
ncbi:hypothetical protein [Tunicatimonas pelagia]|uniref:hypothetical protein n=1 Tax=Tunicatimonas pelagia TaxID=931531 RepID=UPI002666ABFA|nr:hypothetical protein [Tunicatimonas pelagia]WKN45825.1 hypothetical protein P0M28_12735 [Tunicatimonas pelagia]